MDKHQLSAAERKTFDEIRLLISDHQVSQQYKILRELAHAMDREVHKLGAVRAAIATGAATARRVVPSNPKGMTNKNSSSKKKDPVAEEFYKSSIAQAIFAKRDELKVSLRNKAEGTPEFVQITEQIAGQSLKLRTQLQSFRSSKKNESTDEKKN
jgi:hypothetical protein